MTGWTRESLAVVAEQYAGNKLKHLLFKTRAVPPPWSDDLQHGVDAPRWDNELAKWAGDWLVFVIESEPEPALLVQTIGTLRNCIDHRSKPSPQFPNGGVFWLRSAFKCLIGTPDSIIKAAAQDFRQLELFQG